MPKPYNDKKFQLGEPLASMLADFMAANYNAPALEIIREAVKEHIDRRLEEPVIKARYEEARRQRLGLDSRVVKLLNNKE